MSIPDFESDQDFSSTFGGINLANAPDGSLVVTSEKHDEFDSRITSDIEGLLFLGRLTHDCDIYGHSFTLRTLTRGERLAISLLVREYEDTLGLADALETAYLAFAIQTVDGRPLSIPLQEEPIAQHLRRNFEIVRQWYDPVIEALYMEYSKLLLRQKIAFEALEGKSTAGRTTPSP